MAMPQNYLPKNSDDPSNDDWHCQVNDLSVFDAISCWSPCHQISARLIPEMPSTLGDSKVLRNKLLGSMWFDHVPR